MPILKENFGQPFWFYDAAPDGACGEGAVGVINSNESGNETLAGFEVRFFFFCFFFVYRVVAAFLRILTHAYVYF